MSTSSKSASQPAEQQERKESLSTRKAASESLLVPKDKEARVSEETSQENARLSTKKHTTSPVPRKVAKTSVKSDEHEEVPDEQDPEATIPMDEEAEGEEQKKPRRAPRDPYGHKMIKVVDVLESAHKNAFLPIGDGMFNGNIYFQPFAMRECGKNSCEMEMLEMINGTLTESFVRTYTVDAEDLLKMCYLHAMANVDVKAGTRMHFEQWVMTVFQEYCASCAYADYTDRGAIAQYYLQHNLYSFAVGFPNAYGDPPRLEIFFQKRCIRDISSTECTVTPRLSGTNLNAVFGKSVKSKFEYQIEGFIMSVPEGIGIKQRREEREARMKQDKAEEKAAKFLAGEEEDIADIL